MASERPWLRKERSREGCAPPANTAKGALPPVASGSEISEPQKKIPQMSGGRNCHAELGSPFKAKQTKAMQPQTSRPGTSGLFVSVLPGAVSQHTLPACVAAGDGGGIALCVGKHRVPLLLQHLSLA